MTSGPPPSPALGAASSMMMNASTRVIIALLIVRPQIIGPPDPAPHGAGPRRTWVRRQAVKPGRSRTLDAQLLVHPAHLLAAYNEGALADAGWRGQTGATLRQQEEHILGA